MSDFLKLHISKISELLKDTLLHISASRLV